jgi:hypothetical protein
MHFVFYINNTIIGMSAMPSYIMRGPIACMHAVSRRKLYKYRHKMLWESNPKPRKLCMVLSRTLFSIIYSFIQQETTAQKQQNNRKFISMMQKYGPCRCNGCGSTTNLALVSQRIQTPQYIWTPRSKSPSRYEPPGPNLLADMDPLFKQFYILKATPITVNMLNSLVFRYP